MFHSIVAVVLICLFFAFGFYLINKDNRSTQSSLDIHDTDDVQFEIVESSNIGATYMLSNTGDDPICFAYNYSIEVFRRGKWFQLPHEPALFNTIQLALYPEESESYTCNWMSTYGTLTTGQYRIVKRIERMEKGVPIPYWVASEFVIE